MAAEMVGASRAQATHIRLTEMVTSRCRLDGRGDHFGNGANRKSAIGILSEYSLRAIVSKMLADYWTAFDPVTE